jgi:mannose-6-phosphate isomerase-like protein (cupin superfamily)
MVGQELHLTEHETLRITSETPEQLEVEASWGPGGKPPPPHLHPHQDEEFVVQSGRMTAWVDGDERALGPGDTLVIPRGTPHKMWNPGGESATAIWRTRPALRTAEWFAAIDRLTAGGTRKPAAGDGKGCDAILRRVRARGRAEGRAAGGWARAARRGPS